MRCSRTLARYLIREVLVLTGLGLVGVGSILLSQNLLREIDDVGAVGLGFSDGLAIAGCLAAMLASYALPIAFLFGVLAAVGRLSADGEIAALRALGVSLGQFMLPFLGLALLFSLATGALLLELEPAARRRLHGLVADVAARGSLITPGSFRQLDREGRRMILVEERDADNRLRGVFISDRSDARRPFTVLAERGRFAFDRADSMASIELESGDVHFEPAAADGGDGSYRRLSFARLDYRWDLSELVGVRLERMRARELGLGRLREALAHFEAHGRAPRWARESQRNRYEVQIQRRFALALAPLIFALLGVPLGLRRSRGARSWGALVCVLLTVGYYVLLQLGTYLALADLLAAALALWLPNLVFAGAAVALLLRARRAET